MGSIIRDGSKQYQVYKSFWLLKNLITLHYKLTKFSGPLKILKGLTPVQYSRNWYSDFPLPWYMFTDTLKYYLLQSIFIYNCETK